MVKNLVRLLSSSSVIRSIRRLQLNRVGWPRHRGSILLFRQPSHGACMALLGLSLPFLASAATYNVVQNCGATGNGLDDDTAAIRQCIGFLQPGDTLLFPAGTYKITSSLVVDVANITVDGSLNTAVILASPTLSGPMLEFGNPSGFCFGCSLGSSVSLSSIATELSTSFTTTSSLGVNAGDYVYISQGGQDYSTDTCAMQGQNPPCQGHPTNCDVSGCRGEVLLVQGVSGNTITVATALHDTYDPSANLAGAQKVLNPLAGIVLQDITLNAASVSTIPLSFFGAVSSTVSAVTVTGANDSPSSGNYTLYANVSYGLSLNNVTLTSTAVNLAQLGVYQHGNLSINGLTISGARGGAAFFSSGANDTITNLTVDDASGGLGRPFKTTAVRYSTFDSVTVKNGSNNLNGINIEYYSSHNTFSGCTAKDNSKLGGAQTGNAGINLFGNFNQYNTFSNCTVSGNGNVQFYISSFDALRLAQDSHNSVSGGSFTGTDTTQVEAVMDIEGDSAYVHDATINGPGSYGLLLDAHASNACVNTNGFAAGSLPGLLAAINANGTNDRGSGNNYGSVPPGTLQPGTCP